MIGIILIVGIFGLNDRVCALQSHTLPNPVAIAPVLIALRNLRKLIRKRNLYITR